MVITHHSDSHACKHFINILVPFLIINVPGYKICSISSIVASMNNLMNNRGATFGLYPEAMFLPLLLLLFEFVY